jgi:hypothetical protein
VEAAPHEAPAITGRATRLTSAKVINQQLARLSMPIAARSSQGHDRLPDAPSSLATQTNVFVQIQIKAGHLHTRE